MINLPKETEALAKRNAEARGVSVEEAVQAAIEATARAAGIDLAEVAEGKRRPDLRRLVAISDRCAARPVLDPRNPDEILGYDDFGLPR